MNGHTRVARSHFIPSSFSDSFAWLAICPGYHAVHLRVARLEDGFSVASVLLSREDTEESIHNPPPPIFGYARHITCVLDFPTYEDEAHHDDMLSSEIAEHLYEESRNRLLCTLRIHG